MTNEQRKKLLEEVERRMFLDSQEVCGSTMIETDQAHYILVNVVNEIFGFVEEDGE